MSVWVCLEDEEGGGETVRGQGEWTSTARKYESNTLKILFINKCLNKTEKTTL